MIRTAFWSWPATASLRWGVDGVLLVGDRHYSHGRYSYRFNTYVLHVSSLDVESCVGKIMILTPGSSLQLSLAAILCT